MIPCRDFNPATTQISIYVEAYVVRYEPDVRLAQVSRISRTGRASQLYTKVGRWLYFRVTMLPRDSRNYVISVHVHFLSGNMAFTVSHLLTHWTVAAFSDRHGSRPHDSTL